MLHNRAIVKKYLNCNSMAEKLAYQAVKEQSKGYYITAHSFLSGLLTEEIF